MAKHSDYIAKILAEYDKAGKKGSLFNKPLEWFNPTQAQKEFLSKEDEEILFKGLPVFPSSLVPKNTIIVMSNPEGPGLAGLGGTIGGALPEAPASGDFVGGINKATFKFWNPSTKLADGLTTDHDSPAYKALEAEMKLWDKAAKGISGAVWDPDKEPFGPIPASVYEAAEAKKKLVLEQLKQTMADGLAAHAKALQDDIYTKGLLHNEPMSGVLVYDCSHCPPYGTVLLDRLRHLVGQWKPGWAEVRYIAVGKGDRERLEAAYVANVKYTETVNDFSGTLYFKGIRVREHDYRAGYYMLVYY